MPSIRLFASAKPSALVEAIVTVPSSSILILQPVSLVRAWIVAPPLPITSRILSGWILKDTILGACSDNSVRTEPIASCILLRICKRPSFACAKATCIISLVIPCTLISICKAVMPFAVPATLKSISPKWSSSPKISVKTAKRLPSKIKPIATPATCALTGTPASINAKQPPQTEAIDEEPFDSVISETTRML